MSTAVELSAALLYLAPVACFAVLRWRRDRPLWAIALDIPVALALDLLALLALAHVLRLEMAVFASRLLILAGAAIAAVWRLRRGSLQWPRALGLRELAAAAGAALLAVLLSMVVARACHFADRAWHIPLVSSLRGQALPFHNVYQPGDRLEYHYTGDAIAAMLQSLSFGRMHASLALSLSHNLLFGLFAFTAALLLGALGVRSAWLRVLGALAPLLSGPLSAFLVEGKPTYRGHNFVSFYHLSFRPYYPLAAVFILGFVGAALVALRERARPTGFRTGGVLVACTAALTITDEASIGLLGLALGAAWLVAPRVVHERRLQGIIVFGALLVAVVLPHLLFWGTLAPGGLEQRIVLVPWRAPGFYSRELPLTSAAGWRTLFRDFLPLGLLLAAALLSLFAARRREERAPVACLAALLAVSFVLLCAIEVRADVPVPSGGFGGQNHRFMTAALVAGPLLAAAALWGRSPALPRWWRRGLRGVTLALAGTSLALSGLSTLEWAYVGSGRSCAKSSRYGSRDDFFRVDCRRDAGARPGARMQPAYGAFSVLYLYAGCHPTYLAGPKALTYRMSIGLAAYGMKGLAGVSEFVRRGEPLRAVCPALPGYKSDPICDEAREHAECQPLGEKLVACALSEEDRRRLLERDSSAKPPAKRAQEPVDDSTIR